uniref:Uncharacterized protein n=1 Tax=Arundo donax TaxID=35708 RepID=A0A0A9HG50_ARUDO
MPEPDQSTTGIFICRRLAISPLQVFCFVDKKVD